MADPYRMVFINLVLSLVLIAGLFLYKKIFPSKKINLFFLLLLVSLLPLISILRTGSYESGDLSYHVKFAMPFFDNIRQGNLLPRWMDNNCWGYGCPAYIFIFLFSHYLISFFHLLGYSFIDSAKIVMAASFIISGIGMFLWMKDEFGEKPAFAAAVFYLFSPYHLIDLHFRVSIAELVSIAILPFLFLASKRLVERRLFSYFAYTSVLFALLIISHQVTSLASFPLLIIYGFYVWIRNKKRSIKILLLAFFSYATGILLTAFYWVPIFVENRFTVYNEINRISFHPFNEFFYAPNKFGFLFQGHRGELYTIIGYTQWIIIALGLYILLKKNICRNYKMLLTGSVVIFTILFLMMQSFTEPIWLLTPIINNFQFSWRLLIEVMIVTSVIVAIVIKTYTSERFFVLLCFTTIAFTILNWGNRGMLPQITDTILRNQSIWPNNGMDVLTPIWVDTKKPWTGKPQKKHIEVLSGSAEVVEVSRSITKHEYIIYSRSKAVIKENTFYFPGWKIYLNNKEGEINYKNSEFPGIITFKLNKGLYKAELFFSDTVDRKIGKYISLLTILILLSAAILNLYKFYFQKFRGQQFLKQESF